MAQEKQSGVDFRSKVTSSKTLERASALSGAEVTAREEAQRLQDRNDSQIAIARDKQGASITNEPGRTTVHADHKDALAESVYFRSSLPSFNINWGTNVGERARFDNYWLVTNNSKVADYIREQLIGYSGVHVEEMTEDDYNDARKLKGMVQPTFEPLPAAIEADKPTDDEVGKDLKGEQLQRTPLSTRQARTDEKPEVLIPETGAAAKDQLTDVRKDPQEYPKHPIVDDRPGVTQPGQGAKAGFTVGMQGSVPVDSQKDQQSTKPQ